MNNYCKSISETSPDWVKEEYFVNWLMRTEKDIDSQVAAYGKADSLQTSLYELMKEAVGVKQYIRPINENEDVKRVIKFRTKLTRSELENTLGVHTISVYGVGLYTTIDGVFLSPGTRDRINYDESLSGRKGQYIDLSSIPEDVVKSHEFRLAIPAMCGLFVPKKSRFTEWLRGTFDLQYFDIMQF